MKSTTETVASTPRAQLSSNPNPTGFNTQFGWGTPQVRRPVFGGVCEDEEL
jgi:hypothetical protein